MRVLCDQSLHRVRLSVTPWTVARQAPPTMGISRHEYWSGWPCSFPGDLPDPGIEPRCPASQWILHHLSHQGSPRIQKWEPILTPRGLPNPGIKPPCPAPQADSLPAELPRKPIIHHSTKSNTNHMIISMLYDRHIASLLFSFIYFY